MQKLLREYLDELNKRRKRSRKTYIAMALLVVLVVGTVAGILAQYGVAMTGSTTCGQKEHQHSEKCYEEILICGLEEGEGHVHDQECYSENKELTCGLEETEDHTHTEECYTVTKVLDCGLEETEGHTHTEECYSRELACGQEEHTHNDYCYIDETADVEDQAVWDKQYAEVEWEENWNKDLVTAAQLQLGYQESIRNYAITEDGSHKGYTRYGEFACDPYCDWDAVFVNFCLYYAGITEVLLLPGEKETAKWQEAYVELYGQEEGYSSCLIGPEGYIPEAGDLVFFQREGEETEDQMGIVSFYDQEKGEIGVIEGNSQNEVKENLYALEGEESGIVCYLKTAELEKVFRSGQEPEADREADVNTPENMEEIEEKHAENQEAWEQMYEKVEWTGAWGADLVTAARRQLGYQESTDDYIAVGDSNKGYTRYGAYVGDQYCDWDAAFVNFCMKCAGLSDTGVFPVKTDVLEWQEEFRKINEQTETYLACLAEPEGYVPQTGDLVFLQKEDAETAYQMGIVSAYDPEADELKVIEGNSDNEVKENTYKINGEDPAEAVPAYGYLNMTGLEQAYRELHPEADKEEEIVELTTEVDGTTITMSGPESSFEAGKEYSIQAAKVEDEETIATIEEAIEKVAEETVATSEKTAASEEEPGVTGEGAESDVADEEEVETQKELAGAHAEAEAADEEPVLDGDLPAPDEGTEVVKQVKSYQAFDIKLIADGEEVQPLGPVSVKFSSQEVAESVEDTETEVMVVHVDEETGEATDMEATATEESDVVIETDHFSVYVYVEVGVDAIGGVKINIQHWGENIETVNSDHIGKNLGTGGNANNLVNEEGFETDEKQTDPSKKNAYVVKKSENMKLYSTDLNFKLPSETYMDVRELSKVYNADKGKRYEITKVWISKTTGQTKYGENEESWGTKDVDYTEYTADKLTSEVLEAEINNLKDGAVIRFWYSPKETKTRQPVTFYDYDFSAGVEGKDVLRTEERGINASGNFLNNGKPKLGVGQYSAGNASSWVSNQYNGKNLNAGNGSAKAFTGLVQGQLTGGAEGELAFNTEIDAPKNLFSHDPAGGSYQYDDYKLEFEQNGDTYTLINVFKGDTLTSARNLTEFKSINSYLNRNYVFSNDFWPLDDADALEKKDPLLGKTTYYPKNNNGGIVPKGIGIGGSTGYGINDFDSPKGHNWYFGMTYTVKFTIGDYTGPLEYYFRGDDDFWLFVDGELAVDLGGIHTAIGKTYSLDYLKEQDKNKEHVLKVYYMERGATGSTCYMQFTLPEAKIEPIPEPVTTSYTVTKKWEDNENGFRPQDIQITLYKNKEGEVRLPVRTITLPLRNAEGGYVDQDGKAVSEPVWTYTWNDLPVTDGKTGKTITYDAEEEYIDPKNQTNPMLGYTYKKEKTPDGTQITFTNIIADKRIKVYKKWSGDDKEISNRPSSVTFVLYANGNEYKDHNGNRRTVTLSDDNQWQDEFDHVPEYYYDENEKTWKEVKYSVMEETSSAENANEFIGENGSVYGIEIEKVDVKEDITVPEDKKNDYIASFEVTNTLLTKNVCIEKIAKTTSALLRGATFELYECEKDSDGTLVPKSEPISTYITGENGRVDVQGLKIGNVYHLVETEAPESYALLSNPIVITVKEDGVTVDFQIAEWDNENNVILSDGKYVVTIPNEMFYELPSTGGLGIYWYMFGGVLLMTAAALITYKIRRKEVLRG